MIESLKSKKAMGNACCDCQYCGDVRGSAHKCCEHPATKKMRDDPLIRLASILASTQGGMPPVSLKGIKIKGDPRGIKNGWFSWPMNFDPVWLVSCDGFRKNNNQS